MDWKEKDERLGVYVEQWVGYRRWVTGVSHRRRAYNQEHTPSHTLTFLLSYPFFRFEIVGGEGRMCEECAFRGDGGSVRVAEGVEWLV